MGRAVRAFRPELIHCHNPGMAVIGAPTTLRGWRLPGLVTVQGVPDDDYPATARFLRGAGFPVVACGPGVAAGLADEGLAVFATIGNGVSPAPPPVDDIAALRSSWGLSVSGPLAVSVGRLEDQKHHELSIRALAMAPGVSLVILGEGPLRATLEALVRECGVAGRVALPGVRADARSVVASADVSILASHWEGLPLVGLEAAAARTPLVATAVRGVREVFTDEVDALLVKAGDAAALAAAVHRVLAEPAVAARLVAAGTTLATAYDEDGMVAAYRGLYGQLAARPPRRRGLRLPASASRRAPGNGGSSTDEGSSYG